MVTMSGTTSWPSKPQKCSPVRPKPVCTSSEMHTPPWPRTNSKADLRNPATRVVLGLTILFKNPWHSNRRQKPNSDANSYKQPAVLSKNQPPMANLGWPGWLVSTGGPKCRSSISGTITIGKNQTLMRTLKNNPQFSLKTDPIEPRTCQKKEQGNPLA